jgi:Zn-finger nucleic acid-binding protein
LFFFVHYKLQMETVSTSMKCPNDGGELAKHTYEAEIDVDKCPQCDGIWLDHSELERIQSTRERSYTAEIKQIPDLVGQAYAMALAKAKPVLKCPRCNRAMERREHGGCSQILIDVCPSCRGIWLDAGETSALEVFFERAKVETAEMRLGFFGSLLHYFR